jgi:hypothetical protein
MPQRQTERKRRTSGKRRCSPRARTFMDPSSCERAPPGRRPLLRGGEAPLGGGQAAGVRRPIEQEPCPGYNYSYIQEIRRYFGKREAAWICRGSPETARLHEPGRPERGAVIEDPGRGRDRAEKWNGLAGGANHGSRGLARQGGDAWGTGAGAVPTGLGDLAGKTGAEAPDCAGGSADGTRNVFPRDRAGKEPFCVNGYGRRKLLARSVFFS